MMIISTLRVPLIASLIFLSFKNLIEAKSINFPENKENYNNKSHTIPKRVSIPVHYVSGSHYEVGYSVGRTYGQMIKDFLKIYSPLHDYLKLLEKPEGRIIYEESLKATEKYFPQYVTELQGVADGAKVSFEELFLMALDDTLPMNINKEHIDRGPVGCSSLLVNQPNGQFLGHTEDALASTEDNYYIIAAHIIPNKYESGGVFKAREEKFEALAYAGHLPGYASGYNYHGVVFSINTIFVTKPLRGRIPREFITRALLSSRANMTEIIEILTNEGVGTADAFHVNLAFLNVPKESRIFHSIEVSPNSNKFQSEVFTADFSFGTNSFHANRFLHLKYSESDDELSYGSSVKREERYKQLTENNTVSSLNDVLNVLGNEDDGKSSIFRNIPDELVKTIHLGVFDLNKKVWMMWTKNPIHNPPLVQLSLTFNDLLSLPIRKDIESNNINDTTN
ncbi:uncharacterized protein LOC126897677 [Daktulosphaira vitifoliae]|uniref:uncharacterized protein LOC126897677 n=1 Tax=Daktulosphaira vitifoliae TaxID=58002 RepID=UPI0021AA7CD7|nr:uncharacterized protein LOC126897677 [Daktulosphaira vitifoliae]